MGNIIVSNTLRFTILLVLQILVFNKINLFGFINFYPYILFIMLYPVAGSINLLLISTFVLGYSVDLMSNTGGVHAMSSLILAYVRPSLFKMFFGSLYENQTLNLTKKFTANVFYFIIAFVLLHHFILFCAELFSFFHTFEIIIRTLVSSVFTILICTLSFLLLKPTKK